MLKKIGTNLLILILLMPFLILIGSQTGYAEPLVLDPVAASQPAPLADTAPTKTKTTKKKTKPKKVEPPPAPVPLIEDTTFEEEMLSTNRNISNWFDQVADSVDLFLVGRRVTTKPNNSRIVFENTTYSRETSNLTNLTNLSINPAFPNLEKYWNLKFTTYDDTTITRGEEKGYARAAPKQNYAATIGLFRKFDDVRIAYEPRIEIRGEPQLSHFLSFDTVADYTWFRFNPKIRPFASSIYGTGVFQALNFSFDVSPNYSLGWINEGEYEDRTTLFSVTNGFSLAHALTDKTAIAYGISFYSTNKPVYHLDAYSISFTWSEAIYKDILDYQITPHIDFTEAEEFRGFFGIIFGFRVYF